MIPTRARRSFVFTGWNLGFGAHKGCGGGPRLPTLPTPGESLARSPGTGTQIQPDACLGGTERMLKPGQARPPPRLQLSPSPSPHLPRSCQKPRPPPGDRPSAKSGARSGKGPGPRSRGAGRKGAGKCCRPEGLPAAAWPRARLPAALPPWTPHSSTARLQRCDPHSQGPGCHRADGEPGRHVGCRRQSLQTPVACG